MIRFASEIPGRFYCLDLVDDAGKKLTLRVSARRPDYLELEVLDADGILTAGAREPVLTWEIYTLRTLLFYEKEAAP